MSTPFEIVLMGGDDPVILNAPGSDEFNVLVATTEGPPGPANTLTIGEVVASLFAGATITGTPPNQVLNLELPKGDKGDDGADSTVAGPPGEVTTAQLNAALAGKSNTGHTHVAADIPGSSGIPSATTYLRGDNTWGTPTNTTYSALTLAEFTAATATTARAVSALLLNQEINQKITGASGTAPTTIGQNIAKAVDGAAVRGLISAVDAPYVAAQLAALVAAAPTTLDTLDEIAAALGDDPNFATTMTTLLGLKAPLAAPALTGAATLDGQAIVKTNDARLTAASTAVQPAALAAAQLVAINAQAAGYTLVASDAGKAVEVTNAGSFVNLTIPTNASVAFPIGTVIEILQAGAAKVFVAAAAGVTLNTPVVSPATRVQWSTVVIRKRATDTWIVAGDLA